MNAVRIGLLGLGTVGGGTLELLARYGDEIARRVGRPLRVTHASVKDASRPRGPLAEQANLFGNDEAMLFIANDQRFKKSGNPVNTSHRRLQHGLLADQRQQLLGIFFTRDRPQAGA